MRIRFDVWRVVQQGIDLSEVCYPMITTVVIKAKKNRCSTMLLTPQKRESPAIHYRLQGSIA
jgi:hypothetical protein